MRTFLLRSFSTVLLLGIFFCSIFMKNSNGYALFAVASLALSFLAAMELCKMLQAGGMKTFPFFASLSTMALVAAALVQQSRFGLLFGLAIILFLSSQGWLLILTAKGKKEALEKTLGSLGVFLLLSIPFYLLISIYMLGEGGSYAGRYILLFLVLATKAGDIGAYLTGTVASKLMSKGTHKMVPSISPGKSWEGAAGGLVLSVAVAMLLGPWALKGLECSLPVLGALGLVLFLGGFIGDLAESSLKRICGVKDSGSSLPGIGGALDLLDSLMLNAPIFALFMLAHMMINAR